MYGLGEGVDRRGGVKLRSDLPDLKSTLKSTFLQKSGKSRVPNFDFDFQSRLLTKPQVQSYILKVLISLPSVKYYTSKALQKACLLCIKTSKIHHNIVAMWIGMQLQPAKPPKEKPCCIKPQCNIKNVVSSQCNSLLMPHVMT